MICSAIMSRKLHKFNHDGMLLNKTFIMVLSEYVKKNKERGCLCCTSSAGFCECKGAGSLVHLKKRTLFDVTKV
ncbi:hypothetical protein Q647_00308 [Bartonella quintana JK 7]|nr:hypothetical protein Q647_00308 [Bartonella quintana JK 7]KEC65802.1 hypothetical protein O7S_01133 [Bartonella quintana JK 67]